MFGDQVNNTVRGYQFELYPRIARQEFREHRNKLVNVETSTDAHAQVPSRGGAQSRHLGLYFLNVRKYLTGPWIIQIAFGRQGQPSSRSMQEADAQPIFQPADEL